jgi:hypothetical protein
MSQLDDDVPAPVRQAVQTLTIRDQVLDALIDKVDGDRYPSTQMMDDIERLLTPERKDDYVEVLLAKIRSDRFPSHAMIQRLLRLSS